MGESANRSKLLTRRAALGLLHTLPKCLVIHVILTKSAEGGEVEAISIRGAGLWSYEA